MGSQVTALIGRYGQRVSVVTVVEGKRRRSSCFAMLQYVKGAAAQFSYSPLGEENGQKLLYLGEAWQALTAEVDWVLWQGRRYQVISAHPVYCGTELAYWRGILKELALGCQENEDLPWEEEAEAELEAELEEELEAEAELKAEADLEAELEAELKAKAEAELEEEEEAEEELQAEEEREVDDGV